MPLDGSSLAEQALPYAEYLASMVRGEIVLARAAHVRFGGRDLASAQIRAAADAQAYFEDLAARLGRIHIAEYSVPFGEPVSELTRLAARRDIDLLIMTTHGRSGLPMMLLGSVAHGLMRSSGLPLLLVRTGQSGKGWTSGLRRILVPLDGSRHAERILPHVAALAEISGARICLLRAAVEPVEMSLLELPYADLPDGELLRPADEYLQSVARPLRQRGLEVEVEARRGRPGEAIADRATTWGADLVAMSTHARAGLDRLMVGSVADEVLARVRVPLLLYRGPDGSAPRG